MRKKRTPTRSKRGQRANVLKFPKLVDDLPDAPLGKGKVLSDDLQRWVIEQVAQFIPHQQIVDLLLHEHKVRISRQAITNFAATHQKAIQLSRDNYMRQLCDTPLAFKRYRLEQLQALYETASRVGDPEVMLDVLKVAAAEMKAPDLVAVVLGHGKDEEDADNFLLDPRLRVGEIDVNRILRKSLPKPNSGGGDK